jgi:hypothetical protein
MSLTLPAKHTVLLYDSEDEFVSVLRPFVEDGLTAGEPVITVASPSNLRALRESLGPTPPTAYFVESAEWYARPPDTMAAGCRSPKMHSQPESLVRESSARWSGLRTRRSTGR